MLAQTFSYTDPGNSIVFQGYTDPVHNVTYGTVFPPLSADSTEFIGEFVVPVANQWVGISFGGAMADSLLLVAWPYENTIISSARWTECVSPPLLSFMLWLTNERSQWLRATPVRSPTYVVYGFWNLINSFWQRLRGTNPYHTSLQHGERNALEVGL